MYIKMSDFFMGMGKQFTIEVLDIAEKLFQNEGDVLFDEGDPAKHFFVLLKGRVKLSLGATGPVVYMVRHPGEIIGWSGLIEPHEFAASTRCLTDCDVVSVKGNELLKLMEKEPEFGLKLAQRLARLISSRMTYARENLTRGLSQIRLDKEI